MKNTAPALHILKTALLCALTLAPSSASAVSLTKIQDLMFGKFITGPGYSGTITVGSSGERSGTGAVRLLGGSYSPARFALHGFPGEPYAISIPDSLTMTSNADGMDVTAVTCSIPLIGVLPLNGTLPFTVGGTLTVKALQRASSYSGNFNLSVRNN